MSYDDFQSLDELGWGTSFARQLVLDGDEALLPVRVLEVHRDKLRVAGEHTNKLIELPVLEDSTDDEGAPTVGDWLLLDPDTLHFGRLMERQSLFKRRAAGTSGRTQLIAANIDTVFIVSSCNQDFNEARLERYLVLAREANVFPVVVLTKADLSDSPESYAKRASRLLPSLLVETVNALDPNSVVKLAPLRLKRKHRGYGDTFYIDEVFVRINGKQHYLWRAVDQDGEVIDAYLQAKRDGAAAKRFFKRLLRNHGCEPRKIVTDKLRSYGVAHRELILEAIQQYQAV